MYEISVKNSFSAAHHLKDYNGLCSNIHGHNWEIEVFISGDKLNELGFLVDFKTVKEHVETTLAKLDHRDLNSLPAFSDRNPTSENIAKYLYKELSSDINNKQYHITGIKVSETSSTSAFYRE
jgi:6-pyruvoyltetrahydropterin/6-carboxytetrahydropterin synthase